MSEGAPAGSRRGPIAAFLVVAAGITAYLVLAATRFDPEAAAASYLDDVASGRAEVPTGELSSALLRPDVVATLADAAQDLRVVDVSETDGDTRAEVAYSMAGEEHRLLLELDATGSRFGVFDRWEVTDVELAQVTLSAPYVENLSVNGVDVSAWIHDGATFAALPGSYEISPVIDTDLVAFVPQTVEAVADAEATHTFELDVPDAVTAEVDEVAGAHLAACIARREAQPPGCPNRTFKPNLTDLAWTLTREPSYEVVVDFEGTVLFRPTTPGTAVLTAISYGEPYEETVRVGLSGTVTADGAVVDVES